MWFGKCRILGGRREVFDWLRDRSRCTLRTNLTGVSQWCPSKCVSIVKNTCNCLFALVVKRFLQFLPSLYSIHLYLLAFIQVLNELLLLTKRVNSKQPHHLIRLTHPLGYECVRAQSENSSFARIRAEHGNNFQNCIALQGLRLVS